MKKILLLLLFTTLCLNAQKQQKQAFISVSGEGIVNVIPDQVVINIRVEHAGISAQEVKKKNDVAVNNILKFCKGMKIDKKDIHTQYINLNKNYDYKEKKYNYKANQAIRILLRDIDRYEALIQGLLDSGTNRIDGVSFKSSQLEKHKSEARKKAISNAKRKAMEYAGALQQNVGRAISISENSSSSGPRPPMYRSMQFDEMSVAATNVSSETIAVGEMKVSATVHVTFELK